MARLNQQRQAELEPLRIEKTVEKLKSIGIEITFQDKSRIEFIWKGETVKFFPYSGWHAGKSIKDGRGFGNLLKQLKNAPDKS